MAVLQEPGRHQLPAPRSPGPHRAALPPGRPLVGAIQPYTPITGVLLTHAGGDLAATQAANADVHAKLLTLLAAQ
jgi:hypothetical protein